MYLCRLSQDDYDANGSLPEEDNKKEEETEEQAALNQVNEEVLYNRGVRKTCVEAIRPLFDGGEEDFCFASRAIEYAE